jgi:F-type H+-transporting ATPase subunit delta
LNQEELSAVQRKLEELTGGTVIVQTEVDESILGGLIVRIGDRMIDGSTRSRLVALTRVFDNIRSSR